MHRFRDGPSFRRRKVGVPAVQKRAGGFRNAEASRAPMVLCLRLLFSYLRSLSDRPDGLHGSPYRHSYRSLGRRGSECNRHSHKFGYGPSPHRDMSLSKSFNIRESQTLQFRSEFFDTFNHPQFSLPNTVASAASGFGAIGSTSVSPRIIQLALKYSF